MEDLGSHGQRRVREAVTSDDLPSRRPSGRLARAFALATRLRGVGVRGIAPTVSRSNGRCTRTAERRGKGAVAGSGVRRARRAGKVR